MEVLKVFSFVDGQNDTPFPNAEHQVELNFFDASDQRMSSATISATIFYPTCLDNLWTGKEYVLLRGERYFLFDTPSSAKSYTKTGYTHEAIFLSYRSVLDGVYFYDVVAQDASMDKPASNSTSVVFYGDIHEFAKRLNASLAYRKVGFSAVVDDGITSEEKQIAFNDMTIMGALQEMFNTYEVPFYFVGNVVHIGFTSNAITQPFRYGVDYELLGINKNNADYKIVRSCTGVGSSDNIPYYYPNNTPKGIMVAEAGASNKGFTTADVAIVDGEKFAANVGIGDKVIYTLPTISSVQMYKIDPISGQSTAYNGETINVVNPYPFNSEDVKFKLAFNAINTGLATFGFSLTLTDKPHEDTEVRITNVKITQIGSGTVLSEGVEVSDEVVLVDIPKVGQYEMEFETTVYFSPLAPAVSSVNLTVTQDTVFTESWRINEKIVYLEDIGISITGTPQGGDYFTQVKTGYIKPQATLMPSIYRESNGEDMFYKAINNTYPIPDTDPIEYYEFPNEYLDNNPSEHKVTFEDIKPTIAGIENASGQLFGAIADIAFDDNDNDDTDEDGNYLHPYFFVKLHKFNGEFGFNLFQQASESGAMTISMTSGQCGACQFEIGVGEETQKNIVQVDSAGNLKRDEEGNILWRNQTPQDRQNDTRNYEVWIALKKDNSTFGVLMPNATNNYRPQVDDTFVILNILLPDVYITAAEKRLDEAIIKYMSQNNTAKYNFSVEISRIFLAQNKNIADLLNSNARINLEYNGQTYPLYVSQYTYSQREGNALPSITLELEENATAVTNSLKTSIDTVKNDIMNSVGSIDFLKVGLKYFLRKDVEDFAREKIAFLKGLDIGQYTEGTLGGGGRIEVTPDGSSKLTIDFLDVRKRALFTSLTIQELKHIGGKLVLSPAAMVCSNVEELSDRYRCYFNTSNGQGGTIYNEFVVGDQAIKQTNNETENSYYWRLVIGVGEDYIDLSKKDADIGSNAPKIGDNITQLGNRDNPARQAAQILSAFGDDAPSHRFYNGINSFSLANKEVTGTEFDKTTNLPRFFCYGNAHIGHKNTEAEDATYIDFNTENGVEVKGKIIIRGGSGLKNLDEWEDLESVEAIAKGFTQVEGGLIYSNILKLMEVGGSESAGVSGIPQDENGNYLPFAWAGGSYADAKAGNVKVIILHNGNAKFGQFEVDAAGRLIMNPASGTKQPIISFSNSNIPSIADLGGASGSVVNSAFSTNVNQTGVAERVLSNTLTILNNDTTVALNTNMKITYTPTIGSEASAKSVARLFFIYENKELIELGKVEFDSATDILNTKTAYINYSAALPAGTYALAYSIQSTINRASIMFEMPQTIINYEYSSDYKRNEFGADGFLLSKGSADYLRAAIASGGLDFGLKTAKGFVDMPGVLGGFEITYPTTAASITNKWGKIAESISISNQSTGEIIFSHSIGHTEYFVMITPQSEKVNINLSYKDATSFTIDAFNTAGAKTNAKYDVVIIGNNK